ncbi:IclR family transcriptional regulator domain-containing protein [Hydrogenophaga sp. OTU3427]|uniref:IclR family transcriptional regulator domain-containing protein n=1 Tax=Hydrogenophaga sp. OTU3427 TaxID=3043856 RepID=UPI00313ADD18
MTEQDKFDGDKRDPQSFIRALARGLSVIEGLSGKVDGCSLSEVANECDLDRATARRILMTLTELRYVRATGSRYFLAPRALSLGYAYLSSIPYWEVAAPIMEQLVQQINESCSAATLDGAHVVYVARVRSNKRFVDVSRTVGSRIPAYCTSLGRILLSALPSAELKKVFAMTKFVEHTRFTVTDIPTLTRILSEVKQQGWAVVDQEMEIGLRSLAVPLHDQHGAVVAALNVSVQADRISVEDMIQNYLEPLKTTAQHLDEASRTRQTAVFPLKLSNISV